MTFHPYGFFIGLGVVFGIWVIERQVRHFGKTPGMIENSLLWIAIPAVLGARLYHVVTDWALYVNKPFFSVFEIWNGGLGFFGALIGGLIGLSFYIKMRTTSKESFSQQFFTFVDLLAFGAPLAQAIGRFGNYFNQELYGLPTNVSWAIEIQGGRYHPLFAYEALSNLLVFLLLQWLGWKKKLLLGKGQYACVYLASYGLIRFWLEFLRTDSARLDGIFHLLTIAQWVSLGTTIGALSVFWLRRHAPKTAWEFGTLL